MLKAFKKAVKKAVKSVVNTVIKAWEHVKIHFGYPEEGTNANGEEYFMIDDEEILKTDTEKLEKKAEEITETVLNTATFVFFLVISMLLVNDFFVLILIIVEVYAVFRFLQYVHKEYFSGTEGLTES